MVLCSALCVGSDELVERRPEEAIAAERRTQKAEYAQAISTLPMLVLFLFVGMSGLFGIRRLAHPYCPLGA